MPHIHPFLIIMVGLFTPQPDDLGSKQQHFPSDLLSNKALCQQVQLILGNFNSKNHVHSWELIKPCLQEIA